MSQPPFASIDAAAYALPADVVARTLSPAFVVYLDRVRDNVRRVLELVETPDRWRPHLKTTKIREVWRELLGAGVRNFKCATTREARQFCELVDAEGVEGADLLVAYPLVGPALAELGALADAHPRVRVSVLCEEGDAAASIAASVSIFVDVDPGMHRTGLPLDARDAILAVARGAGERFRGVHYYDGHLHQSDPDERRRAIFACHERVLALRDDLIGDGHAVGELITSGTPAFRSALAFAGFDGMDGTKHRVSPGTVVFHDLRSELENPELGLVPAACVLARIVSHPTDTIATCDAGSKSIAAEAGAPVAHVLGEPRAVALTPSEEHLPLQWPSALPARGSTVLLVPMHVCPTTNLAERALLVDGDEVRVVDVGARAHDLLAGTA